MKDVSFSYGEREILRNVNLTIPMNSFTAIIGASGAGKTTIADLLIGLVRPDSGDIFVDDTPMSEIQLRAWRGIIGYVPQETILFHESVYVNVTLGDPSLDRMDARTALEAAGAWEFVSELEDSLDTMVGERGMKLSGGQRQRIAIARALVRRPRVLILDEVTSALDPATEAAICDTLKALSRDRAVVVISHQPTIVEAADLVYRLERGSVTQVDVSAPRGLEKAGNRPAP